jgi:hypothetical protein
LCDMEAGNVPGGVKPNCDGEDALDDMRLSSLSINWPVRMT